MPRKKAVNQQTTCTAESADDRLDRLTEVVDRLADEVHVLREAIDDARAEFEYAVRNTVLHCRAPDIVHISSMPKDPTGPVQVNVEHRQGDAAAAQSAPQQSSDVPSKQREFWGR
jgi:hypothetical protein